MADELDKREDRELESIHRKMEQTRANLGDKLEKLEAHVTGTVTAATDTVADAVQSVKDVVGTVTESVASVATTVTETASAVSESVGGTVSAVVDTFNIPKQIEAHPWGALGAAFGLGFIGALFLGPSKQHPAAAPSAPASTPSAQAAPAASLSAPAFSSEEPSAVGKLMSQATEGVTELALNAIMNTVRNLTASLPENFRDPANQFVDNMAKDLGVSSKVISANPPIQPHSQNGTANGASQQSRQPDKNEEPAKNRGRNRITA